jgi:hypothetical protein
MAHSNPYTVSSSGPIGEVSRSHHVDRSKHGCTIHRHESIERVFSFAVAIG